MLGVASLWRWALFITPQEGQRLNSWGGPQIGHERGACNVCPRAQSRAMPLEPEASAVAGLAKVPRYARRTFLIVELGVLKGLSF